MNDDASWNINLQGEFDVEAPARVEAVLQRAGASDADVFIDSPGGNLAAAMAIGRLLRKYGARTSVGKFSVNQNERLLGQPTSRFTPGSCFSSCTLAFLGGVYRYVTIQSEFGVHRFSKSSNASAADLDIAQIVSAGIASYIREMDVDPALFDRMVEEGKDSIRLLSQAELRSLLVVNNGRQRPAWVIEAIRGGQILRGSQRTRFGLGQVTIFCGKRQVLYYSFYETGKDRADQILSGSWFHSLMVRDKVFPLSKPSVQDFKNNVYSAFFVLTKEQALAVAASDQVGHAMQLGRDAPTFVGYTIDIPPAATGNVSSFIQNCLTL